MTRLERLAAFLRTLKPVPKVYVPGLAGLGGVVIAWIATGEFDRLELAAAVGSLYYALIGWATPEATPKSGG
ncbi:MAG TPA: hypothetical protein VGK41_00975 [Solirubrobacterales bacterium]